MSRKHVPLRLGQKPEKQRRIEETIGALQNSCESLANRKCGAAPHEKAAKMQIFESRMLTQPFYWKSYASEGVNYNIKYNQQAVQR
jgi:hypothetical protein